MSEREHHLLCLGLMANLYNGGKIQDKSDLIAIEQAIESAEKVLGFPVSADNLKAGLPIGINN